MRRRKRRNSRSRGGEGGSIRADHAKQKTYYNSYNKF